MKWLFYTDGNEVLNCPHNPKLYTTSKASRRAFLGLPEADNFKIIDSENTPLFAVWDGSDYVSGSLRPIWENKRDILESEAAILHDSNLILMDDRSRKGLNQAKSSLRRRSKSIKWKVFDTNTGDKKRIDLNSELIEKFEDAIVDEIESLHIQADTGEPVNNWPVEVI